MRPVEWIGRFVFHHLGGHMTDTAAADVQDTDAATAGQNPNTGNAQDAQPTGFDALPPETQAEIRKLRKENAAARKRVEEFENANKTELQRREDAIKAAEDRANSLQSRLQEMSARSAVTDAATKAHAISPRAVFALIKPDLTFDDDGEPTNVDALIKQAIRDEPSLFRAAGGSGDGGAGGGTVKQDLNSLIRAGLGRG